MIVATKASIIFPLVWPRISAYTSSMARDKFIKIRATAQEQEQARLVAKAVGKDLSQIVRPLIERLARKHKIPLDGE